jgi:hypothetical protein
VWELLKIDASVKVSKEHGCGGVDGLEVACWSLVTKFSGSHQPEAVKFLGRKNPQHAILQRGSKAVGTIS